MTITFKLQYGIYHVLQNFGAGNVAVFSNVPYQKNRGVGFFCVALEFCGTFPDLADAAGR